MGEVEGDFPEAGIAQRNSFQERVDLKKFRDDGGGLHMLRCSTLAKTSFGRVITAFKNILLPNECL